jgi:hypothetical protein
MLTIIFVQFQKKGYPVQFTDKMINAWLALLAISVISMQNYLINFFIEL